MPTRPKLFKNLADTANLSDAQLQNYLDTTGRTDLKNRAEITEEILADSLHKILNDVHDKNLLEKIVAWIRDTLSKFKEIFHNKQGGLKTVQYERMANTFGNIAKNLTDANGNKIFRFNSRTKKLELANGHQLPKVELRFDNSEKFIDNEADMDENTENQVFDKYLTDGIRDNVEKVISKAVGNLDLLQINSVKALRDIRDSLKYFTKLNANYHFKKATKNSEQMKLIAVWLEYARRRFDYDERIREKFAVQVGNYRQQGRVYRVGEKTRPEHDDRAVRKRLRESNGTIQRYVTAEHIESHNEFLKLYNEQARFNGEPEIKIYPRNEETHSVIDDEKSKQNFERHLQNVENNFDGAKFSIGSNDNSTAALAQRVKNFLAGTNTHNERTRKRIKDALEKLSGYKIAAGHIADGIDIVVKDVQKVIRTRNAYDYEKILPEVGGKIAEKLNLNPTAEMKNYIAEWILTGAPNNTSAEAESFQRAMSANDNFYRDQLIDIRNIFQAETKKDIWEQLRGRIAYERGEENKSISEKAKSKWRELYEQFVEELQPVQDLVESVEKEIGRKLKPNENPMTALRLYRGAAGIAKIMIEGESKFVKQALQNEFPNLKFENFGEFKTMFNILKDIGALEDEKKHQNFSVYLAACHVKDIHEKNKTIQQRRDKAEEKIKKLQADLSNATDKKEIKELEKNLKSALEKLDKIQIYQTPFTEEECDKIIAEGKEKFDTAQKDMVRFSNFMLEIAKECGLVSEDTVINMRKDWKNYVPLFRVFDENENVSFGDSLKFMTGSSRDLIDPLLSIGRNTYTTIKRAEKNRAKILLANLAREGGVGSIIEEVENKNPNVGTTITFYEGGKKKYLDTDPSVVKAVNNLTPVQMSAFMRFLRIGTTLVRNLATVYNPNFALRNLVRDPQDAYLYSKYGYFSPFDLVKGYIRAFTDMASGFKSAWKKDEDYYQWMASGGAQASFWSVDRDYAKSSIEKLTRGKYGRFKSASGILELFKVLGEYSELGTRIGHFKRVKSELAKQNGGKIDQNILITAALESRDLMDFARGGKASREWNAFTAFANASIQGADKFWRTFDIRKAWSKDENVRKEWQRAMIRLAIGGILPALLTFLLHHDEDWYKKDIQDWEKETHWILGEHLRIPKGADVGIRFISNATETLLNNLYNDEPIKLKKLFKPLFDVMPDLMPTAIQPIFECAANYNFFTDAPVVSYRLQKLPENLQSDSRTSWLAKTLGDSSFAKFFFDNGISPQKLDHFFYGYTANAGKLLTKSVDVAVGDKEFSPALDWLPIIGGFLRVPYKNPRVVNDYYELFDEQTKLHEEFKTTHKKSVNYNPALYKRLKETQKLMSKLSRKERAVLENPNIGSNEKDSRQAAIQKQRIALVEKFFR